MTELHDATDDSAVSLTVTIRRVDGKLQFTTDDEQTAVSITEDEYTGDWCVNIHDDPAYWYVRSRRGAIVRALQWLDVIDDADYELAPTRDSA